MDIKPLINSITYDFQHLKPYKIYFHQDKKTDDHNKTGPAK